MLVATRRIGLFWVGAIFFVTSVAGLIYSYVFFSDRRVFIIAIK